MAKNKYTEETNESWWLHKLVLVNGEVRPELGWFATRPHAKGAAEKVGHRPESIRISNSNKCVKLGLISQAEVDKLLEEPAEVSQTIYERMIGKKQITEEEAIRYLVVV